MIIFLDGVTTALRLRKEIKKVGQFTDWHAVVFQKRESGFSRRNV